MAAERTLRRSPLAHPSYPAVRPSLSSISGQSTRRTHADTRAGWLAALCLVHGWTSKTRGRNEQTPEKNGGLLSRLVQSDKFV